MYINKFGFGFIHYISLNKLVPSWQMGGLSTQKNTGSNPICAKSPDMYITNDITLQYLSKLKIYVYVYRISNCRHCQIRREMGHVTNSRDAASSHIGLNVSFFNSKITTSISKWYKTFLFLLINSTPQCGSYPIFERHPVYMY